MNEIRTLRQKPEIAGKVIRSPKMARELLKLGDDKIRIIDIKQNRDNKDQTVFIFQDNERFQEAFSKLLEEGSKNRVDFDERVQREVAARVKEEVEKVLKQLKNNEDEE